MSASVPITSVPQQLLYPFNDSGGALLRNSGASIIYIDSDSSCNTFTSLPLNIGASIQWKPGIILYAVCATGTVSTLDVVPDATDLFDPLSTAQEALALQVPSASVNVNAVMSTGVGNVAAQAVPPGQKTLHLEFVGVISSGAAAQWYFMGVQVAWFNSNGAGPIDKGTFRMNGGIPFSRPGNAFFDLSVKGTSFTIKFVDISGSGTGNILFDYFFDNNPTYQNMDYKQFPDLSTISANYNDLNHQDVWSYSESPVTTPRTLYLPGWSGFGDLVLSYAHTGAATTPPNLFIYPESMGLTVKIGDVLYMALPITGSGGLRSSQIKLPPAPCAISFNQGVAAGNINLQLSMTLSELT